jgi:hypothetical protein
MDLSRSSGAWSRFAHHCSDMDFASLVAEILGAAVHPGVAAVHFAAVERYSMDGLSQLTVGRFGNNNVHSYLHSLLNIKYPFLGE